MSDLNRYDALLGKIASQLRGGRTIAETAEDELGEDRFDMLDQLGFLLLKPDSLVRGTASNLLDFLEDEHAVQIVRLRVLKVSPLQHDQLYHQKMRLFPNSGWLHHEISRVAPAAAVLIRGKVDGSLSCWMDRIKGESAGLADDIPESLRSLGDRPSSLHSVIHTAESTGAMLAEATLFFQWWELRDALDAKFPPQARGARQRLLNYDDKRGQSVFECLCDVQQRLIASLILEYGDSTGLKRLRQLIGKTEDELGVQPLPEQARLFAQLVRSTREPLAKLIEAVETSDLSPPRGSATVQGRWLDREAAARRLELLQVCWLLSGHEGYWMDDGTRVFEALERGGVPLSPWQQTLVRTGLWADANPDLNTT